MANRRNIDNQEEQMSSLFSQTPVEDAEGNISLVDIDTDTFTPDKRENSYLFEPGYKPKNNAERRYIEKVKEQKNIRSATKERPKQTGPESLYDKLKRTWFTEGTELSLKDAIKLVDSSTEFKKKAFTQANRTITEDMDDNEKKRIMRSQGLVDSNALLSFNPEEEIAKLKKLYQNNEDFENFDKYVKQSKYDFYTKSKWGNRKHQDEVFFNNDILTNQGKKIWESFAVDEDEKLEQQAQSIYDAGRVGVRSVGRAGEDIGSLPDMGGDAVDWIGRSAAYSLGWVAPGISGDETVNFLSPGARFVKDLVYEGSGLRHAHQLFSFVKDAGKGLNSLDSMQYQGFLKDKERLTNNLELIGSMAVTYPLEVAALSFQAGRQGARLLNPEVGKKLRNLAESSEQGLGMEIQRAFAKKQLAADSMADFIGIERQLKKDKRAIFYANTAMVAGHLALESVEEDFFPGFKNSSTWNGLKIPFYLGTALGGAKYGPNLVAKTGARLGLVNRSGPPSTLNKIKYYFQNKFQNVDIDDYLKNNMNLNEEMYMHLNQKQKLELAGLTSREYKYMQDFGSIIKSIKKSDAELGTTHFTDLQNHFEQTLKARDDILEVFAETSGFKKADGSADVDSFVTTRPDLAELVDVGLDDMIQSDSLRATSALLNQGHKLPILGKFDLKTIYKDLNDTANKEVKQRTAFAKMLRTVLPDESNLNTSKTRFLEDLKKKNDANILEAKNMVTVSKKKFGEERIKLVEEIKQGLGVDTTLPALDYNMIISRLDPEDLDLLNTRHALFKDLNYTPKAEASRAFRAVGLEKSPINLTETGGRSSNISTPLQKFASKSKGIFYQAMNKSKGEADAIYDKARESNKGKYINVNEAEDVFSDIKASLQQNPDTLAMRYGTNPNEYGNFGQYMFAVGRKFVDRAVDSGAENQLDTIVKSYVKKADMDDVAILDALDAYKLKATIVREGENIPLAEATISEYGDHAKGLIANSYKEGNNFLAIGIDLNSLNAVRRDIGQRATTNFGTPLGKQLDDLYNDLGLVLEVGSKKFMDTKDYVSFLDANKFYAENFASLFKQGASKSVLRKQSGTLENVIPDENIWETFITAPTTQGMTQFNRIFKGDEQALDSFKEGIGRYIDNGNDLDVTQLDEMRELGIISDKTFDLLDPSNININQAKLNNSITASEKRLDDALELAESNNIEGLLNSLVGNAQKGLETEAVYKLITQKYIVDDLKKLAKTITPDNYRGGVESFKSDMLTVLTPEILRRTTYRGNTIADRADLGKLDVKGRQTLDEAMVGFNMKKIAKDTLSKIPGTETTGKIFRKSKEKFDEFINADPILAKDDFGIQVDSQAFVEVLDEVEDIFKFLDRDRYDKMRKISNSAVRRSVAIKEEGGKAIGSVRNLSVESVLSRIYSIQRGVVSFRYVASEATLQAFRANRFKLMGQLMQDPRATDVILDTIFNDQKNNFENNMRWIRFIRGWAGISPQDVSDKEIEKASKKAFD